MSPHSDTPNQQKTIKRPASAHSISDNGKKQRGRPRVAPTPEDGTAADRRRTQIRLAQRAYRQRKETTIASCKHQVSNLQKVIEDMNATFSRFSSEAFKSGLASFNVGLTKQLETATQKMDMLVRKAEDVVGEDMTESNSAESRGVGESTESGSDIITTTTLGWNETQSSTKRSSSASSDSTPPTVWGYSVVYEPEQRSDLTSALLPQPDNKYDDVAVVFNQNAAQSRGNQEFLQHNFSLHPGLFPPVTTQNFMTLSLPSPTTYSFNETTFARRLYRACLEDVYFLLSNPAASPDMIWKKFRFSMAHSSLADIRDRIGIRLSRSNSETLDSPYQYEQGVNGLDNIQVNNLKAIQPAKTDRVSGPQKPQVAVPESTEGHDGWLSPEEVQGFVESKGFILSVTASFAEGEVVSLVPGPYSNSSNVDASLLQSPPKTPDFLVKDVTLLNGYSTNVEFGVDDTSQAYPAILTQNNLFPGALSQPSSSGNLQMAGIYHRPTFVKKRVLLDITKFLREVVQASVCRGKTPKLRQEELERALHVSAVRV